MGKIVLLDELTINQIAAGEVIERPASVVKEMVENSIDAGSKNIVVEIKKGGIDLIKITDDGCGISEDDMEIAFERHATSKIRSSNDLETVKTMGFRGEALASIAAIARVEMVSKTLNDSIGHKIIVEGGDVKEKSEIGCQKGTTITVENLFYNTPVRYKFLRKDYTEAGYIEDVLTRIALVNKNVSIKLINSGKVVLQTSGNNDMKSTVYSIFGKDVANGIIDIDYTYENIKITGVIGKPEIARGNRGYQLFFVNGRYVKDKTFTSAADGAYKDILPIGKYGFIILNLQMDPKMVDVNVHPAKLEVRFENESLIYKSVYHAIKSGLENVQPVNTEKSYTVQEKKSFEPSFSNNSFSGLNFTSEMKKTSNNMVDFVRENIEAQRREEKIENEITNKIDSILAKNDLPLDNDEVEIKEEIKENESESDVSREKLAEVEKRNFDVDVEKDIVQPKLRGGLAGLWKKVRKNDMDSREAYKEENLVEALFEARNGKKRATPFFESELNTEKNDFKEKVNENVISETIKTPDILENNGFENKFSSEEKTSKDTFFNFKSEMKDNNLGFENNSFNISEPIEEESVNDENNSDVTIKFGNVSLYSEAIPVDMSRFHSDYDDSNDTKNEKESISIKFKEPEVVKEEVLTKETPVNIDDEKIDTFVKTENKEEINENVEEKADETVEEKNESAVATDTDNLSKFDTNDFSNTEKITESIMKNKIECNFEPTQIVDTKKIRENIEENEEEKITPEFAEMYKKTFGKDITKRTEEKIDSIDAYNDFLYNSKQENENIFDNQNSYIPERKYTYIGNVFNLYMIIEMGNDMYIIDQRLAYERIIYEKIKANYYNPDARDSQILLLPDIISLNKKQLTIAAENVEMFEKAGFGFEDFGENTIKLYAVPGLCEKLNTKQLFLDILNGLNSVSIIAIDEKEEKFISIIAYNSATKAKINLDESEIIDMLNSLFSIKNPFTSSDGRQIAIKMSKVDFEKKFSRR